LPARDHVMPAGEHPRPGLVEGGMAGKKRNMTLAFFTVRPGRDKKPDMR
jgi:hypothetical protein